MTVRLTESRLRQIIREELASLRESAPRGRDPLATANKIAAEGDYRYSHYIDLEIYDTTGRFSLTSRNIDVTEDLVELIDPGFDDLRIMAILTEPPRNKMGMAKVRIYGSEMDLEEVSKMATNSSEVPHVGKVTPNPASHPTGDVSQMVNPYGERFNAPIRNRNFREF